MMNKVKVKICRSDYSLTTDEPVGYIQELAAQLDAELSNLMNSDDRITLVMAAVLTALVKSTEAKKAEETADNLRAQMKEYLDDNARYRQAADNSHREIERLRREIDDLHKSSPPRPRAMRAAPEILAPAGSPDALRAAVRCGADAVYLGASRFSARQNAQNFDTAAFREAVSYCHARGAAVHLALNHPHPGGRAGGCAAGGGRSLRPRGGRADRAGSRSGPPPARRRAPSGSSRLHPALLPHPGGRPFSAGRGLFPRGARAGDDAGGNRRLHRAGL